MAPASQFSADTLYCPETHQVENQPYPLVNYNSFLQDIALQENLKTYSASWATKDITRFGAITGSVEIIELGFLANENKPKFYTHNRHGKRVDEVKYHPAYHQLMKISIEEGLHASHWIEPKKIGSHVARAAKYYLMAQVEAGHGCPITMTSAAIPALKKENKLYDKWAKKIMSSHYDYKNIASHHKNGLTIGMAMTEKQGGSDIRLNSTSATPIEDQNSDKAYQLIGHKYFVSAPMSDAFLMLAKTKNGISCFLVPRWKPDGSKNPLQIQQLKNKMGNISNASSEIEIRGALGWLIGEEGRGIATIIDMVAMTRFDCMIGSAAGMRQAVAQITFHCQQRFAFGDTLINQPLMQNVLADLILESEAALALTMRMANALDNADKNDHEKKLLRIGTAIGKYWICKRAPAHAYEAMECIGGSGVMEEHIISRLFRDSPINSIWEGSGNVQCLDMLRAIYKDKSTLTVFFNEINQASVSNPYLKNTSTEIKELMSDLKNIEFNARTIVEKMALCLQAATLLRFGNKMIAEAFCTARLAPKNKGFVYGTLPQNIDCQKIINRAMPCGH